MKKDKYIKLNKDIFLSILENHKDENETRKNRNEAYCDLLRKAVKKYMSPRIEKYKRHIEEGQCQITITDLANTWKWQRRTVRCFLKELENAQAVIREKNLNFEILTLWEGADAKAQAEQIPKPYEDQLNDILSQWEDGQLQNYEAGEKIENLLSSEGKNTSSAEAENCGSHLGHSGEQQVGTFLSIDNDLAETICLYALRKALRLFGEKTKEDSQKFVDYFNDRSNHNYGNFLTIVSEVALLLIDEKSTTIDEAMLWDEDTPLLLKPFRAVLGNIFTKQSSNDQ